MDFDESRLYYSHQQLQVQRPNNDEQQQQQQPAHEDDQVDWSAVRRHFREFLREFLFRLLMDLIWSMDVTKHCTTK